MSDHLSELLRVQQEIQKLDEKRTKLQAERAKAIRAAKDHGMNNRQVARALGVHEPTVYRLQRETV